jgi:nitroreductase
MTQPPSTTQLPRAKESEPATEPGLSLLDGIMTTRAMRRLKPDPIPEAVLWRVLAAANQAPSGGNIQPWQFMMVTSPDVRAQLAELYRACYDRYETAMLPTRRAPVDEAAAKAWDRTVSASRHLAEHFHEVPAIAVVLAADIDLTITDESGPLDIGSILGSVFPAVQNLMLAARAYGIGTALTTVLRIEQGKTREILAVPDRWQVVAVIPMGYPEGRFGVAPRKPVEKVTHWDRFGEKRPQPI